MQFNKNATYIKWNKRIVQEMQNSFFVFLKRNYSYIKIFIGKYILQKSQEFEGSGLYTKTRYLKSKIKPYAQITAILCLISFAIMSQIIAIKNYHDDKEYVSKMNNYNCEKEETSLSKRILWTISR